jgi:hypothetical protein
VWLAWSTSGATFTSLVDNKGNTYTQVGTEQSVSLKTRLYVCENGAGGAGHTVTFTLSVADFITIFFGEAVGGVLDTAITAQGEDSSSPYTIASGVPSQAESLVVAAIGTKGTGTITHTESSGFGVVDEVSDSGSFWTGAIATKTLSSAASQTISWTATNSTDTENLRAIGFKTVAASGPPTMGRCIYVTA